MPAYIDWGSLLEGAPKNCWLAVNQDETKVLGHGSTPEEAIEMARRAGTPDPILMWSPETMVPRVL